MAEFKPTKDQQRAIEARDSAILVSAAAGSGKTKVLTERLMGYITGPNPKSIDSFLIITYTRAAAGELRSRIMDELNARMGADPSNTALRRQYGLVSRAQISTIHGFCSALIREHCLPLGLDPDFKVVDEGRTAAMKQAALEQVLEDCYERIDTDEKLRALIDTVGAGRDDKRLAEVVLQLHGKMQSHAYPAVWAEGQRRALYAEGLTDPGDTVWGRLLLDSAGETADYWARELETQLGLMAMPEFKYMGDKYGEGFAVAAEGLRNFAAATKLGWDKACDNREIVFPRLLTIRNPAHPAVKDHVKGRWDACKKAAEKLTAEFDRPGAEVLAELRQVAAPMEALLDLTLEFDRVFAKEKKRRGLVDYSDLEHFAARLLSDEGGNPTDLARQVAARYTEIMVDEYQDVSEVQELIFRCVSQDGANLFTVGDVKQSIYRFRLAEPAIFTGKYLAYADYEDAAPGAPRRILLQENFRSRGEILDAANAVFENIMSTRLGELEYDEHARLRCGAAYYTGQVPKPCLHLLAVDKASDEEEESVGLSAKEQEAAYVAAQIQALVHRGTPVTQGDGQRPARYEDIVILLRSANAVGPIYRRALEARGIPVRSQQSSGFYHRPEITAIMALLAVVDNPMQDVPLLTALRSGYVGFTADELARVRAADKRASFYEALVKSREVLPKAERFLRMLDTWRSISGDVSLRELIWRIMEDLNMAAITGAMTDGQLRRRNLMAFIDLTTAFESTGFQGLRRFLVWLDRQIESGVEPEVPTGTGGDGVQIMSIHKSKGLEFPIVFLCDTAHRFNTSDSTAPVLVHPELGLGPKVVDTVRGVEYYSMPRRAIQRKMTRETLSEEMRLLYVAMTRPKEYLFMTAGVKDPEKFMANLESVVTAPVAPQVLESAGGMAGWIAAAALADGERNLTVERVRWNGEVSTPAEASEAAPAVYEAEEALVRKITEQLAYVYPHAAAVTLPSKVTATELKYLTDTADSEAAGLVSHGTRRFRKFRPDGAAGRVSAVEKGVATHLVFQHIDYSGCVDLPSVQLEVNRLHERGILNDRQRDAVDSRQVAAFFASDAGKLMRSGDTVLREFKFSLLRPAGAYFADAGDDEILLQGVIDCAVEKDGKYTVIDYKTDNVTAGEVPERAAIYGSQVAAYSQALEEMTGKPVEKTILYFLKPGVAVEM